MGRAADRKHQRRRADAARQRLAGRNEQSTRASIADAAALQDEQLAGAVPADRKAVDARRAEVADAVAAHPWVAAQAAGFVRQVARAAAGVRRTDGEQTMPRIAAKMAVLADRVRSDPHAMCEHLEAGPQPVAMRCAVCPAPMLYCLACFAGHDQAHDPAEEYRCDECGQVDRRSISPVRPDPMAGVPVIRAADDVPRILPAAVMIAGIGICDRCRAAAGQRRAQAQRP